MKIKARHGKENGKVFSIVLSFDTEIILNLTYGFNIPFNIHFLFHYN